MPVIERDSKGNVRIKDPIGLALFIFWGVLLLQWLSDAANSPWVAFNCAGRVGSPNLGKPFTDCSVAGMATWFSRITSHPMFNPLVTLTIPLIIIAFIYGFSDQLLELYYGEDALSPKEFFDTTFLGATLELQKKTSRTAGRAASRLQRIKESRAEIRFREGAKRRGFRRVKEFSIAQAEAAREKELGAQEKMKIIDVVQSRPERIRERMLSTQELEHIPKISDKPKKRRFGRRDTSEEKERELRSGEMR